MTPARFAELLIDRVFPGPASGRSGALRQTILDLELKKRDCNLRALFDLEKISPAPSAWVGLGTIAYEIILHYKPRTVVELGSFGGFSACAMALALKKLGENRRLYAVDTWEGDFHTRAYGEQIFESFLNSRRQLGLDEIIVPLRMLFESARASIPTKIDVLHIDGWHTFHAVFSDFKAYRNLLSPNAIVMFHDVYTGFSDMRLFWSIISRFYPSYRIPYSKGLGIIQLP